MNTEELYYSLVNNGDINSIRNESMNIVNRVMGYLHNPSLTSEEIKDIEYSLYEKREELRKHRSNSLYEKSIEELKRQIKKIENDYRD